MRQADQFSSSITDCDRHVLYAINIDNYFVQVY